MHMKTKMNFQCHQVTPFHLASRRIESVSTSLKTALSARLVHHCPRSQPQFNGSTSPLDFRNRTCSCHHSGTEQDWQGPRHCLSACNPHFQIPGHPNKLLCQPVSCRSKQYKRRGWLPRCMPRKKNTPPKPMGRNPIGSQLTNNERA